MHEQPLVSILMTSYNREKYIGKAIESVLNSSYRNLELIIVDDQSKDDTVAIARSYADKDARVRVYINEKNLGDYPNRNKAAEYARGKYIKYVDADDLIYPWGLEIVVNCMEQHPDAGYGLDSIEQDPSRIFPFELSPREAYERHYFGLPTFHKAPTSAIMRTEIFRAAGGFSGKWMVGDFEMWHKLSRTHKVLLMPMGIVWARSHEEQESQHIVKNTLVQFRYTVISLENLKHPDCPLPSPEKERAIRQMTRTQARSALRSLLIERKPKVYREKLKMAQLSIPSSLLYSFKNGS
jgi:glycosyltransferase involved in cell wall biosynthesis